MQLIAHRKNTIDALQTTPVEYGVEVDIRSYGERLIVHHEPFVDAVEFEQWIQHYRHKTLILNIKEEWIESRVKEIVERHGIEDYFFLDLSFPALVKMTNAGERRVAVRFSEYEALETVLNLEGKLLWVWVDCFTRLPIDQTSYQKLRKAGFKICLVSPELQGYPLSRISEFKTYLTNEQIDCDAVCTKQPDFWR